MHLKTLFKSLITPSKQITLRISNVQPVINSIKFDQTNHSIHNSISHEVQDRSQIIENFAEKLLAKKYKQIAFLTGAGISVSAGIPDFRSPETGLYAQIKKEYDISDPQKIFSIRYYQDNPLPFMQVIRDFFSREYHPTYAHKLIHQIYKRKQLLINITQNIDGLELKTGINPSKVVQAHGHMRKAHCVNCNHIVNIETYLQNCKQLKKTQCPICNNLVKPKIVFFGEFLPNEFYQSRDILPNSDCVVVMGTSLGVFPFANLINEVGTSVPIYIINNKLPKNISHLKNQIEFIQGDINEISKQIIDYIN
ncbi:SIR2 family transcriptional regulator (macronuclear) [Tetrahymena thermophila SB210]|uniref:SIR2 family transcriptional regulator n=1 Tax=Tetrahymena thermophila (strain SB210) TaxID=312017 RepID=Q22ZC3_TETTS|nr:SIR2 family transcriptional regulator [Tetrahymena thermophila SB210]EAR90398.1 SIR2 family transcriptional regulator [Tetrahymena thermophila SB210]|eukprot:XP_001010643.1 SIR2 family transcriptional regulator [Tetrahymena thermophila SB210]